MAEIDRLESLCIVNCGAMTEQQGVRESVIELFELEMRVGF